MEELEISKDTPIIITEQYDGVSVEIGELYWWRNQEDDYNFLQEIFIKLGFANVYRSEGY